MCAQNSILAHSRPRPAEEQARRPGLASLSSVTPVERVDRAPSPSLNANGNNGEARKPAGSKKSPVEGDKANQQKACGKCCERGEKDLWVSHGAYSLSLDLTFHPETTCLPPSSK